MPWLPRPNSNSQMPKRPFWAHKIATVQALHTLLARKSGSEAHDAQGRIKNGQGKQGKPDAADEDARSRYPCASGYRGSGFMKLLLGTEV